jgi:murein DD-endopeptidase MepM/ murein hydrolase activator NlpD
MRFSLATALAASLLIGQRPTPPALTITAASRSVQPGELVVLTVTTTAEVPPLRARAFERRLLPYRTDPRSWVVLVGIDVDVKPGKYQVTIDTGPASVAERGTHELVVLAKRFPTRTLKVDEAFVNPPASAQKRIADETQEVARIWSEAAPEKLWTSPFIQPVPQPANSAFGTRSIFNGQPRSAHSGADFPSPAGTPVAAPAGGRVALAKDLYFSGNTVIIDHGTGVFSMLAHLSAIDVERDATVARGDVVGKVGATGRVTGPHLHWTVRVNGARVDPLALLAMLGRE